MESSSTFRSRDHLKMENSIDSSASSRISSPYFSLDDKELEVESMTGQGIAHLCSELLELKVASDEDFHRNIFSNYSAFVRIFEEAKHMEDELMQLKVQLSTQKGLVKDLIDGIYLKVLSTEMIDSIVNEEPEESSSSELEVHIKNVSETLDILLSENRISEVIDILVMEAENLERAKLKDFFSSNVLTLYNSEISERKAMVTSRLKLVSGNPRTSAPELQKALIGLHRLDDNHLATQLLLKYYHSRVMNGIHRLQCSKSLLHGLYIKELSRFIFSMMSQAAQSFAMVYGETSYTSELIQWACEETEVFALSFSKYVKSIAETSGGLSTAVEGVQFALSYCSLLEAQGLILQPCLINQIRPCMEEVLQTHIEHFKKVIGSFATADAWVLGRYLMLISYVDIEQQPEHCLLTKSGQKFLTLLQAITECTTPLLLLQMEASILEELTNLFMEYMLILEKALICEIYIEEKGDPRINFARLPEQQVSLLANLSTLEQLFPFIVQDLVRNSNSQHLDNCIHLVKESTSQLRAHFCQQFICRIMSLESGSRLASETPTDTVHRLPHNVRPSVIFQELFIEFRKLDKFAEENTLEKDWLMELLRELMEATFSWISSNIELWVTGKENLTVQDSESFNQEQFIVNVYFLVEIARYGGYFSNSPLVLLDLMTSALSLAAVDPERDLCNCEWAKSIAIETIEMLLRERENLVSNECIDNSEEEAHENQIESQNDSSCERVRSSSDDSMASDAAEAVTVAINTEIWNAGVSAQGESSETIKNDDLINKEVDVSDDNLIDKVDDVGRKKIQSDSLQENPLALQGLDDVMKNIDNDQKDVEAVKT
ncbi:exocyst complex component EXO84B-like isoform X2 [Carica papaya]|uniref:exocyst complex component EXO84B-like isoform X2 n=1 Tax=Carica papaya TaxID=3649 RepID=UPI000B8D0B74|nr:exocyst complex component EXO84B-like isoform X2 [Carica papaya]